MGAGKTTVGRHLARLLKYSFYDSDHVIEEMTGANIPWIFEKEGECGFRKRETQVLMSLTKKKSIVLATGGGAVIAKKNRQLLTQQGIVVYLYADVATQLLRTQKDKNRPLLQQDSPELVLQQLFTVRDPLYRELADIIIPTSQDSPKYMATTIIKLINEL